MVLTNPTIIKRQQLHAGALQGHQRRQFGRRQPVNFSGGILQVTGTALTSLTLHNVNLASVHRRLRHRRRPQHLHCDHLHHRHRQRHKAGPSARSCSPAPIRHTPAAPRCRPAPCKWATAPGLGNGPTNLYAGTLLRFKDSAAASYNGSISGSGNVQMACAGHPDPRRHEQL